MHGVIRQGMGGEECRTRQAERSVIQGEEGRVSQASKARKVGRGRQSGVGRERQTGQGKQAGKGRQA
jgi:hypothetical protein